MCQTVASRFGNDIFIDGSIDLNLINNAYAVERKIVGLFYINLNKTHAKNWKDKLTVCVLPQYVVIA